MKKISLLYLILTISILSSCAAPGEEAARRTVARFLHALYEQNSLELEKYAPFFKKIDQAEQNRLFEGVRSYPSWEILHAEVKGRSAIVLVRFFQDDKEIRLRFPLKIKDRTWQVQKQLSFSSTIDFIPATP